MLDLRPDGFRRERYALVVTTLAQTPQAAAAA
jgi:hypothetical protein